MWPNMIVTSRGLNQSMTNTGSHRRRATSSPWVAYGWVASLLALLVFCVSVFGYRGVELGADTHNYLRHFERLGVSTYDDVVTYYSDSDLGFYLGSKLIVDQLGVRGVFVFYSVLLALSVAWLAVQWSPRRTALLVVMYITSPAFFALGANVLRHGVAVSLLAIGTTLILKGKTRYAIPVLACAVVTHLSAVVYIAALLGAKLLGMKRTIALLTFACGFSVLGLGVHHVDSALGLGIIERIFGGRFNQFLEAGSSTYQVGFRLDFVLFTMFPIVVLHKVHMGGLGQLGKLDQRKAIIVKTYMLCSAAFFMAFAYPYSDRLGLYAWILMPLIMAFTLRVDSQSKSGNVNAYACIAILIVANVVLNPYFQWW